MTNQAIVRVLAYSDTFTVSRQIAKMTGVKTTYEVADYTSPKGILTKQRLKHAKKTI